MTSNVNGALRTVIAAAGVLVALGLGIMALARDTPTRDEMWAADTAVEQRVQRELTEIKAMLKDVRNLQLQILMGNGGDNTRRESDPRR